MEQQRQQTEASLVAFGSAATQDVVVVEAKLQVVAGVDHVTMPAGLRPRAERLTGVSA